MSLNQSMNISLGSMKNNQYALTVVSQNIANVHVEGYHRQGVNFQTNRYTTDCENVISTIKGMNGASISSLTDYIDDSAFKNLLNSNSDAQYYNTLADAIGGLEDISDDLGDSGLNALLNEFYKAVSNLEQFPTDMSIRQQYVMAAQNVCEKFNQISSKCDSVQEEKFNTVSVNVETINGLLEKLATANQEHIKNNQSTATKSQINDVLSQLSNYMDITTETNENGSINLYIGDVAVVKGGNLKYTLSAEFDSNSPDNAVQFSLKSTEEGKADITNGITDAFDSGSLKAYLEFLNGSGKNYSNINDIKASLDEAAKAFATELNAIQTYSDDTNGVFAAALATKDNGDLELIKSEIPMFKTSDGTGEFNASNIAINEEIINDPFLVAAARINLVDFVDENIKADPNWMDDPNWKDNASTDWQKAVGNSSNATEITALQNKKICSYGDGVNNCTLSQFLTNNAAKTGADIADIQSKADTAQSIADSDATNYSNLVGVNLDEELADMIKYQRSYEASAKLFSTINDLMGTIIGMV